MARGIGWLKIQLHRQLMSERFNSYVQTCCRFVRNGPLCAERIQDWDALLKNHKYLMFSDL